MSLIYAQGAGGSSSRPRSFTNGRPLKEILHFQFQNTASPKRTPPKKKEEKRKDPQNAIIATMVPLRLIEHFNWLILS